MSTRENIRLIARSPCFKSDDQRDKTFNEQGTQNIKILN